MIKKFTIFFCHKDINYFNQVKKKLKTNLPNHDAKPLFIWHYLGFSGVMDRKKLFIFYIYVICRDFLDFFFWRKKLYKYGISNLVNIFVSKCWYLCF